METVADMRVIRGLESVGLSGVVLTIGNFDGVHLGHQAIFAAGRRRADAAGASLAALSFDPHPIAILAPRHAPPLLTPLDEKLRLLGRFGADVVVLAESRPELLQMTADEFISQVIVERFRPIAVVEGASFGFGRRRQGNCDTLRAAAAVSRFEVEVAAPVRLALAGQPDTVISSSLVRRLVAAGTVDQAAMCLGRPYTLIGPVLRGAGRGRSLGFPTINLPQTSQLVPGEGVYAGRTEIDGRSLAAAISIGRNLTFGGNNLTIEAYLLDFAGELYDRPIRLEFLEWLRPQQKYDSPDPLRQQIERDVAQTRSIAAAHQSRPL